MKTYFAYIRVSTAKQGEKGVSLIEQRDAIIRFAGRENLEISEWFEERVTAAKQGARPKFSRMLKLLKQGKANGILIHKIDRSARNLRDWADLGELVDAGFEIYFANENLNLKSNSGRLSADLQAVISANFIRNLREETRKGFYGRLKQGLFPLPAPVGYLDIGKGKAKEPDPIRAPLIIQVFEMYASGKYPLYDLLDEIKKIGLTNKKGGEIRLNGLSYILNNPFYYGLMRINKTGETFEGIHEPIITKSLFDNVQAILRDRTCKRVRKHDFLYRKMLKCPSCNYSLSGEKQKGHIYYRCRKKACPTISIRETAVEEYIKDLFEKITLNPNEQRVYARHLDELDQTIKINTQNERTSLCLQLEKVKKRKTRLTDALLDGILDKDSFNERNVQFINQKKKIEENLATLERKNGANIEKLREYGELLKSPYLQYNSSILEKKREILNRVTANRIINGKVPEFTWQLPYQTLAERVPLQNSTPRRGGVRTFYEILGDFMQLHLHND